MQTQFNEASSDPAEIQIMAAAYELALTLLGLRPRDDAITRLVAAKIIDVFGREALGSHEICYQALAELGVPPELL